MRMNNYIEELECGDCFIHNNSKYIMGIDVKKNGNKLCINLENGSPRWFESDSIIEKIAIFYTDKESNIIAIKETKKDVDY